MLTLAWLGHCLLVGLVLFVPGLAVAAVLPASFDAPERLLVGCGAAIVLPALLALLLLPLPVSYLAAAPFIEGTVLAASIGVIAWRRDRVAAIATDRGTPIVVISVLAAASIPIAVALFPWDRPQVTSGGKLVSTRAPYFPGDSYLQYRTAEFIQNRMSLSTTFFQDWFITDRTPLVGAVTAFLASALGIHLPTADIFDEPYAVIDTHGYWLYRLVSTFSNALAAVPTVLLARHLLGRRVALLAAVLFVVSPFVAINLIFAWPKLLVGYFYGCCLYWAAVRQRPLLAGAALGLGVLAHPVGVLYVPGVLIWKAARREWRWVAIAVASLLILTVPWFAWADLVYRHPSRMLDYPLGHIIRDPTNAGAETREALAAFLHRAPLDIAVQRLITLTGTFTGWPFFGNRPAWVLAYNVLRGSFLGLWGIPLAVFGYISLWRAVRSGFWMAALVVPSILIVLYWGIGAGPIAQEAFQPLAGLWIALASAVALRWSKASALPLVVLSIVELLVFLYVLVLPAVAPAEWSAKAGAGLALIAAMLALAVAVALRAGLAGGVRSPSPVI